MGQGWPVVAQLIDEGASRATLDRPALHALMAGTAERTFDRVIDIDPGRLLRDLIDGLILERDLPVTDTEVSYLVAPTIGILERQVRGQSPKRSATNPGTNDPRITSGRRVFPGVHLATSP